MYPNIPGISEVAIKGQRPIKLILGGHQQGDLLNSHISDPLKNLFGLSNGNKAVTEEPREVEI